MWAKLGLTNTPGLAETSRKKGGERFALSRSIKQAMSNIKTLSTQASLSQGGGAAIGGAVVTHMLVRGQEVRVFRNPANHAESATTISVFDAQDFQQKNPTWEVLATANVIHERRRRGVRGARGRRHPDEPQRVTASTPPCW